MPMPATVGSCVVSSDGSMSIAHCCNMRQCACLGSLSICSNSCLGLKLYIDDGRYFEHHTRDDPIINGNEIVMHA